MKKELDFKIPVIMLDETENTYLNLNSGYLYVNGEVTQKHLTRIPLKILEYLATNPDIYLSKDKIRENCWPNYTPGDDKGSVESHICKIRAVLKPYTYIKTNTGFYSESTYCCTRGIIYKSILVPSDTRDDKYIPSEEAWLSKESEKLDVAHLDSSLFDDDDKEIFNTTKFCTQWHKYYRNTGRYQGYSDVENKIDNEKTIISTKVVFDGENEGISLYDVLLTDNQVNNISLTAKGGYGKTFILLQLAEKLLSDNKDILPFYIPLSELNYVDNSNKNHIISLLASKTNDLCNIDCTDNDIRNAFNAYNGTILLLLDGLNEITDYECRKGILKSIVNLIKWTQINNSNIKMIVTSRYDFSSTFSDINESAHNDRFVHCQINELSDATIKTYLEGTNSGVSFDELTQERKQLLRTPQGLHMYVCLVKNDSRNLNFKNFTELIGVYIDSIFKVSSKSSYDKALQKTGYEMVKNGAFKLTNADYEDILKSELSDIDMFNREIRNENLITSANDFSIEFSHQNYRDYFCAKYIAEKLSAIKKETLNEGIALLSAKDSTMSDEILGFVADLLGEYRALSNENFNSSKVQNVLNCISTINIDKQSESKDIQSAINRLILIARFGRKNNIASLVLNNLYISNVSLNGCTLYRKYINRHNMYTVETTKFENTVLTSDTFAYNGIIGYINSVNIITDNILMILTDNSKYIYNVQSKQCTCVNTTTDGLNINIFGSFEFNGSKYFATKEKKLLSFEGIKKYSDDFIELCELETELDEGDTICCYDSSKIVLLSSEGDLSVIYFTDENEIARQRIATNIDNATSYCISNEYLYIATKNEIYRTSIFPNESTIQDPEFFANTDTPIEDMCFVSDAKSIFVCGHDWESSTITRISEISKKIIGTIEKKHNRTINEGGIFSGFTNFKTNGKRLFCGIYMDIVGVNCYPIGDICEVLYDTYNSEMNLVFIGHNTENSNFIVGFLTNNIVVAYSRNNSILLLNVDSELQSNVIYASAFTGVGGLKILQEDSLIVSCLDGNLQRWKLFNNEWGCTDVLNLYDPQNNISGNDALRYCWKIISLGDKIYTSFLGRQIIKLQFNNFMIDSIKKSNEFPWRVADFIVKACSGKSLLYVLSKGSWVLEEDPKCYILDEDLNIINAVKIAIDNNNCYEMFLTSIDDEVYIVTEYHADKSAKLKICKINDGVPNETEILDNIEGGITSIDSIKCNGKAIFTVVGQKYDFQKKCATCNYIKVIYQNDSNEWIEWEDSETIIEKHHHSAERMWDSVVMKDNLETIQMCTCSKHEVIYFLIDFNDGEIKVLKKHKYNIDFLISCIELFDNKIFLGDYKGEVHIIDIEKNESKFTKTRKIISTEAGIISNYQVDLSNAVFEYGDGDKTCFKGYFNIPD